MSESEDVNVTLKLMKKKRGICKSKLTMFKKYLDTICASVNSGNDLDTVIIKELETRLNNLENVDLEFETFQSYLELNDDEHIEEQLQERELFQNIFYKLVATAKEIVCSFNSNKTNMTDTKSFTGSAVDHKHHVKLPSLLIPTFSGKFEMWLEFRDTFLSLIHNNLAISNIEKFYYLRNSLEGNAREIIQNINCSSANYEIAWDLLCERYDNKSMLVNNHLKILFELPSITKESASGIRKQVDGMTTSLRSLEALGVDVSGWDLMIIYIMCGKLDSGTAREWQEQKSKCNLPTLEEFKCFLKSKANLLDSIQVEKKDNTFNNAPKAKYSKTLVIIDSKCPICQGNHGIGNCNVFLNLAVYARYERVKSLKMCLNCLKPNHISKNCSSGSCKKCNGRHHTLLHYDKKTFSDVSNEQSNTQNGQPSPSNLNDASLNMSSSTSVCDMLLSTAMVEVVDSIGGLHKARVLLDSGSQSNFVTESLCNKLDLEKQQVNISIIGINQVKSDVRFKCNIGFGSLYNGFKDNVSCLVVPTITGNIPSHPINVSSLKIPRHLKLADPGFATPGSIDLLLGVGIFYQLLAIGQFSLGTGLPVMQKSRLGWLVSGPVNNSFLNNNLVCNFNTESNINNQLTKFWSIEEPPSSIKTVFSDDEKMCEEIFVKTVKRDRNGRFFVKIPFYQSLDKLGDSSVFAKRQFFAMERRLQKNSKLKEMYLEFMSEYRAMGHMTLSEEYGVGEISYFLPHHGVLNENSSTTKLRVVFNGSAPSDTGISLNDLQYTGPKLQDDLLSILLRFRLYNVVVCADIAKMYRMVNIQNDQKALQKIYWREDPQQELKVYTLNTVTYGTTSAPYLAIRCLIQMGLESQLEYPVASNIILHDFYVDDMLTGATTVSSAIQVAKEVSGILKSAGFILRKWLSNSEKVIHGIAGSECNLTDDKIIFGEKTENKTLGLYWSYGSDVLKFHISDYFPNSKVTKRVILSETSKIFDPLGLVSPCIVLAKIVLQKLWFEKVGWDSSVPSDIFTLWTRIRSQLHLLNNLSIQRQVICQNYTKIELHGFCDASIEAYGGCLYLKSIMSSGECQVSLVYAKSRVAPLKTVTLPRLELCGALILAQIVNNFLNTVSLNISNIFLWTDSTIVLGWLATSPHLMQTFVANRVAQIQTLTPMKNWYHVRSEDNPADIISRGNYPKQLIENKKWWNGPCWLKKSLNEWPISIMEPIELPEMKKQCLLTNSSQTEKFPFSRFSNYSKLVRCFAFIKRFYNNCKVEKVKREFGPMVISELENSRIDLIFLSQQESFPNEFTLLKAGKTIIKGPLKCLNPYLDNQNILRVGGRLQLSELDYEKKHPVLINAKHHLTKLIFRLEHLKLLHAGPQHLLASIREHYWVIGGRNLARHIVHHCVTCFRVKPKPAEQLMGILPTDRVKVAPPFHTTGVDYTGVFYIKSKSGRGSKLLKCYVCLFICFTTRAIHLELVSDLTTEAFILTFRRFIARRGKPAYMISDNGSNFIGAAAELKELGRFLKKNVTHINETFIHEGVNWKFIPAHSPNFGGIWEAGVKTCKYHLKRVMGNCNLTFEQFSTLLAQVEATINSRPLVPMSSDPSDGDVLTPAHFLIGRRLTSFPDLDLKDTPDNRLNKYQHIQKLYQQFWKRWSNEYIVEKQKRLKWNTEYKNLKVGQLVILQEDNLPPLQWKLGRVTCLHPGPNGTCRVVTVRVGTHEFKRSIRKLCPLPVEDDLF